MKRLTRNQIAILITVVCGALFYQYIFSPCSMALQNMATGADAERASSLRKYVLSKVSFDEKSLWNTNEPPVYFQLSRNAARLDFYGVTNFDRQEQIVAAIMDWQTTNRSAFKLTVRFFEPEKARSQNGEHLETLLREEFIVLSNKQFGAILNTEAQKY